MPQRNYKSQISFLHLLQILVLAPPEILYPALVPFPQFLQNSIALETWNGVGSVTTSPFWPCFFGRWCFFLRLIPSANIFSFFRKTLRTLPCLPRSFPEIILTMSPFFIRICLNYFFRQ